MAQRTLASPPEVIRGEVDRVYPSSDHWQEVQDWFRSQKLLLGYFGINPRIHGLVNQKQLETMHNYQCDVTGSAAAFKLRGYRKTAALFLIGAAILLAFSLFNRDVGETNLIAIPWWASTIVLAPIGAVMGDRIGLVLAGYKRWKDLYTDAIILGGQSDIVAHWRHWIPYGAIVPLPRMTFVAEKGNYYFGNGANAGVLGGRILLKCPASEGFDMREATVRDLLNLEPGEGDWTGTAGGAGYALVNSIRRSAALDRLVNSPKKSPFTAKNGLLFALGVMAAIAALNLLGAGTGGEVPVDPNTVKDSISG